jgi:AraC-like DNA-binding protein
VEQSSNIHVIRSGAESLVARYVWKASRSACAVEQEKILPKGTAEIIFNLTDSTLCFKDAEQERFELFKCSINGLNTSPFHLIKGRSQTFIGIQLHAYALKWIFGIPGKEFTDKVFDGFDVCPSLRTLYERLTGENSFDTQVELILDWLRMRLQSAKVISDRSLLFDLHSERREEELSVSSICKRYNLSDRHLRRLASDHLGINTEDFVLYRKYLNAFERLHHGSEQLTTVALESGFYDQAHFNKTFKAYTGLVPSEYRRQKSELIGHLYYAPGQSDLISQTY